MQPPHLQSRVASRHDTRLPRRPLIVVSHLRWGFVFQRPQHLLTRLAEEFEIFFVEEPVANGGGKAWLGSVRHDSGVEVLTPHTAVGATGFHADQLNAMVPLLAEFLRARNIADPYVWLYTPMALPLVAVLKPHALIYDCMDDLASFKYAPPELVKREAALMRTADLVLTGGPSLYERRKHLHANVHCLPSAVDAAHFAPRNLSEDALDATRALELHVGIGRPRIGFFGVIDERLDLELLDGLAGARPDWQFVMVGPVVKIDPATLPTRPNIRWLGMQSYEMLPYLQAQWDVCMLPFALNEATRFISPTKTLEYLAGEKPVVSTPILDVVSLYGELVRIADGVDAFVGAISAALADSAVASGQPRTAAAHAIAACTWDATAETIVRLIQRLDAAAVKVTPALPAAAPRQAGGMSSRIESEPLVTPTGASRQ